ncbi:MAG: hypothetical protein WC462_00455 [archaeon]
MVTKRAFGKPRPPFVMGFVGTASGLAPKLLKGVNRVPAVLVPTNPKLKAFAKEMAARNSTKNRPVGLQASNDSQVNRKRVFVENAKKRVGLPAFLKNGRNKP